MDNDWTRSSYCDSSQCVEVRWHTASATDVSCVEVGVWVKSTHSGPHDDNCVEVAGAESGEILVRDSKDREGPVLRFTPDEWVAFIDGVKNGEFNLD